MRGLVDRNTVLAAAIRAGLCDFGPTATWYEVAGPFLGSKAATLIADICENPSTYDATIRWLAAEAKYCRCARRQRRRRQRRGGGQHFCSILGHACCVRDSHVAQHRSDNPGLPNAAYLSMVPTYPGLVGLDAIAALRISVSVGCWRFSRCCWGSPRCVVVPSGVVEHPVASGVQGALCGNSPTGLVSAYSIPLALLSDLAQFGEPDDGMVGVSSCNPTVFSMGSTYTDAFYLAAVNHADSTGRNGNGDFGDDRQPCKWYAART